MRMILSSSFSNAFLGGIAVWAFLTQGSFLVWAAVIAWGCFFHTGGTADSLRITIAGNTWGVFCAWCAGLLLTVNPASISAPLWAGVVVGCITMIMVFVGHQMAAHWRMGIVVVPACFYGAAATFAYMVQTPARLNQQALLSFSPDNALIAVPISMIIGALLGFATAKMTVALATPRTT
jgi:Protein of unknown function (DUF1097)